MVVRRYDFDVTTETDTPANENVEVELTNPMTNPNEMIKGGIGGVPTVISAPSSTASEIYSDSQFGLGFRERFRSPGFENIAWIVTVAGNELNFGLTDQGGSALSTSNPGLVYFPVFNSTGTTKSSGVKVTTNQAFVLTNGSTIGHSNAVASLVHFYFVNSSGVKLAVSSKFHDCSRPVTTVAEGGAGGADSATTLYSDGAYSNVPAVYLGSLQSTQATAGAWVTALTVPYDGKPLQSRPTVQKFLQAGGTQTWTKPLFLKGIKVAAIGGGGGGGGADGGSSQSGCGGGGGAGGIAIKYISADSLGNTESITFDISSSKDGAGGAAGNNQGNTGCTTAFGAHCSATGGEGGNSIGASGTSHTHTRGGVGGVGSSGDLNIDGGAGAGCLRVDGTRAMAGGGGVNMFGGGGGVPGSVSIVGNPGTGYGGGGGGAQANTTTDRAGGAGAGGAVIVEEFYI